MKPNGLDIKAINPKNAKKYSPNLFKFMTNPNKKIIAEYAAVYSDKQGVLWLGYRDEDSWFMGARLMAVLCNGRRCDVFAYPPVMGSKLVEVAGFWKRYVADGRCAIDKAHDMYFMNDQDRWTMKGNRRSCNWCGKVHQKKVRFVKKIKCERWVAA